MYGDFEAQRHWLEITAALPVQDWYRNTTQNDLLYWGLDYPPLTAYFSLALAKAAEKVVPEAVALHSSRGTETPETKLFMRASAIVSDVLVFFPAAVAFVTSYHDRKDRRLRALALILLQPALILIDHGHFQYNAVSLGLALWAFVLIGAGRDVLGSIAFVASLCYKQMALYYAPAVFCFILGRCIFSSKTWFVALKRLAIVGATVVLTFALIWLPFLRSVDSFLAVVTRVFPFNRGLFEDKVANLWCALLPLIKLRRIFSQSSLARLSAVATLLGFLPTAWPLLSRRTKPILILGLSLCSLAFFMFSYQVHEKTILFPLLPVTLLALDFPSLATFLNLVGCFSMFPLLLKDGLAVPYGVLTVAYFVLCLILAEPRRRYPLYGFSLALIAFHIGHALIPPPARWPDLWVMINVAISFGSFAWSYVLLLQRLTRAVAFIPKQHMP
jgi:alpha-1,3-glucosyltransferase